jgi:hypothetical protein
MIGLGMCCCCLIVYLKPEALGAEKQRSPVMSTKGDERGQVRTKPPEIKQADLRGGVDHANFHQNSGGPHRLYVTFRSLRLRSSRAMQRRNCAIRSRHSAIWRQSRCGIDGASIGRCATQSPANAEHRKTSRKSTAIKILREDGPRQTSGRTRRSRLH